MKKTKSPLSIRVIYWIANIILGLLFLVGLAVVAFNVLLFTSFFGDDLQLHVQLPIKVNFLEQGDLFIRNTAIKVELVNATSQIHFFNTPLFIARIFGSAMLIAYGFITYLVFTFRQFVTNVKNNKLFESSNIELLRNIAYGLLIFWIFSIVYSRFVYHYIAKSMVFQQVEVTGDYSNFPGLLLLALFMWVLSHIFLVGVRLREEHDLTI